MLKIILECRDTYGEEIISGSTEHRRRQGRATALKSFDEERAADRVEDDHDDEQEEF